MDLRPPRVWPVCQAVAAGSYKRIIVQGEHSVSASSHGAPSLATLGLIRSAISHFAGVACTGLYLSRAVTASVLA